MRGRGYESEYEAGRGAWLTGSLAALDTARGWQTTVTDVVWDDTQASRVANLRATTKSANAKITKIPASIPCIGQK